MATTDLKSTTQINFTVDSINQADERKTTANSTFAIGGVSCSEDNFVVAENFELRIKFSGKNPAHRVAATRYRQPMDEQST